MSITIEQALDAYTGSLSGEPVRLSGEEQSIFRSALAADSELMQVAEIGLRYRKVVRAFKGKATVKVPSRAPDQVRGIVPGNNLIQAVASEKAALAVSELRPLLANRMAGRQLQTVKRDSEESLLRKPIVLLVANRNDMFLSNVEEARPYTWARGIGLAMLNIARQHRRPLYVVFYGVQCRVYRILYDGKKLPRNWRTEVLKPFQLPRSNEAELMYQGFLGVMNIVRQEGWEEADLVWISVAFTNDTRGTKDPAYKRAGGRGTPCPPFVEDLAPQWAELRRKHNIRTFAMVLSQYEHRPIGPIWNRHAERVAALMCDQFAATRYEGWHEKLLAFMAGIS